MSVGMRDFDAHSVHSRGQANHIHIAEHNALGVSGGTAGIADGENGVRAGTG